jgi:hypothetical protein
MSRMPHRNDAPPTEFALGPAHLAGLDGWRSYDNRGSAADRCAGKTGDERCIEEVFLTCCAPSGVNPPARR